MKILRTPAAFFIILPIILLFICSNQFCIVFAEPLNNLILENDYVRFEFEKDHLGLAAMIDKSTETNHFIRPEGIHNLWEVAFRQGAQEALLTNKDEQCTNTRIVILADGTQRAILEWVEVDWWREKGALTIRVTVDLPRDCGIAQWHITVENNSTLWGVWSVKFPYLDGFPRPGEYDLARPFANSGYLYKNNVEKVSSVYPGNGWSMQFLSMNAGNNGIYWAALDPYSQRKDFSVVPGQESYFLHFTENMGVPGSDYPDFYPIAFGVYRGGWLEACKIYRQWALKQIWTEKGSMSQRDKTPDMIKNMGIWMQSGWSFGTGDGTLDEMNSPFYNALEYTNVPMGIHWYNWHQNRFDKDYPHYFPTMPGFRERVMGLVDKGICVMPYINAMIIDYDLVDIEKYKPYLVRDEAGGVSMNIWGKGSGRTVWVCPYPDFWKEKVVSLVDSLTGYYGVNGVYLDCVGSARPYFCFDQSHGHPLGGGRWWIDSYREMLERIQDVAHSKGRNVVITTEHTAEPWMNGLDGFLTWIKPDDREIPMNQAVYAGYTYYFGSPSWLDGSDRSFIMAQGRAFIWGRQNGWMGFSVFSPENKAKGEYLKRIGQYRITARKFLSFGELLGPIESTNQLLSITESWPTHRRDPRNGTLPAVMGALWKSEDGNLGIFIVNFLNEKQIFSYAINPEQYGLRLSSGQQYRLTQIRPEGNQPIGVNYPGAIIRTENMDPEEIKVIEISVENK